MLPEFDSGTFIKKASLKWNFKKYLKNSLKKYTSKEDSYDEDFDNAYDKLEQIVKEDESKDILSTNIEPIVIFSDRSFITDKGRYNSVQDIFIPNEGETVESDYVEKMSQIVYQKFKMSSMILDYDYYRKIK